MISNIYLRYNIQCFTKLSNTNISNIKLIHFANKGRKKLDLFKAYKMKNNSFISPLINQQINLFDSPL